MNCNGYIVSHEKGPPCPWADFLIATKSVWCIQIEDMFSEILYWILCIVAEEPIIEKSFINLLIVSLKNIFSDPKASSLTR